SNGSASSLTVADPSARRAKIARRVEFANAPNVSSSRWSSIAVVIRPRCFPGWLIYRSVKHTEQAGGCQRRVGRSRTPEQRISSRLVGGGTSSLLGGAVSLDRGVDR